MIASGSSSSIVVVEENEDVTEETTGVLAAASERSRRAEVRQRMQMEEEDSKEREKLAKAAYKVDRHVCHGSYGPDKCSSSITMMRRRLYTICRIRIKPQKAREAQKKKEKALKEKEEKGGKENEEVSEPHAGGAGPSNPPRIGHELGGRLGAAAESRRAAAAAAQEGGKGKRCMATPSSDFSGAQTQRSCFFAPGKSGSVLLPCRTYLCGFVCLANTRSPAELHRCRVVSIWVICLRKCMSCC